MYSELMVITIWWEIRRFPWTSANRVVFFGTKVALSFTADWKNIHRLTPPLSASWGASWRRLALNLSVPLSDVRGLSGGIVIGPPWYASISGGPNYGAPRKFCTCWGFSVFFAQQSCRNFKLSAKFARGVLNIATFWKAFDGAATFRISLTCVL